MTAATTAPTTIFKLFYTHNRTKQILQGKGIKVKRIERVAIAKPNGEFYNAVHVVYIVSNGQRCSTFISCKEYLAQAMQGRRERATEYVAVQHPNNLSQWDVYNQDVDMFTNSGYRVVTTPKGVSCNCDDFQGQGDYLSQHPYLWQKVIKQHRICKHALCTLNYLGFDSLSSYLKAWRPEGKLTQMAATMNKTTPKRPRAA